MGLKRSWLKLEPFPSKWRILESLHAPPRPSMPRMEADHYGRGIVKDFNDSSPAGKLNKADFSNFLRCYSMYPIDEANMNDLWEEADENGDGFVDDAEATYIFHSYGGVMW